MTQPRTPFNKAAGWQPSNANPQPLSHLSIAKSATPAQKKKAKELSGEFKTNLDIYDRNDVRLIANELQRIEGAPPTPLKFSEQARLRKLVEAADPEAGAIAHTKCEELRLEIAALCADVVEAAAAADLEEFSAYVIRREEELDRWGIALDISDPKHPGSIRHAEWSLWLDPTVRVWADRIFANGTFAASLRSRDAIATGMLGEFALCEAIAQ